MFVDKKRSCVVHGALPSYLQTLREKCWTQELNALTSGSSFGQYIVFDGLCISSTLWPAICLNKSCKSHAGRQPGPLCNTIMLQQLTPFEDHIMYHKAKSGETHTENSEQHG